MGRYTSGSSGPRTLRQIFTASNPSVAVPSWARAVRINAVAGGASGAVGVPNHGGGGGAGANAIDLMMLIPAGLSTMDVTIGAGAAATTATVDTNGQTGGDTIITLGAASRIVLRGGTGGTANAGNYNGGGGGQGSFRFDPVISTDNSIPVTYGNDTRESANGYVPGISGAPGDSGPRGAGGYSRFGAGGLGFSALITAPGVNGNPGRGFGSGGSGTRYVSGAAVSSGAGAPGIAIIEFLEAV
jgi:hypothetical protein